MVRVYLPMDRENFQSSLVGARDREYAVCRLKPRLLKNMRESREAPSTFVCDEQIDSYYGHLSGAKKRLPKKTCEGLEYFTLACTNKSYEGYRTEKRLPAKENEAKGELIQKRDPVSGGFTLNYTMDGGPRYEIDLTAPSKSFGQMILLIFFCSSYLRYKNICLVTDSAYGFRTGMCFLEIWGIIWITSLQIAKRRGFLGVADIKKVAEQVESEKEKKKKKGQKDSSNKKKDPKRLFSKDVKV